MGKGKESSETTQLIRTYAKHTLQTEVVAVVLTTAGNFLRYDRYSTDNAFSSFRCADRSNFALSPLRIFCNSLMRRFTFEYLKPNKNTASRNGYHIATQLKLLEARGDPSTNRFLSSFVGNLSDGCVTVNCGPVAMVSSTV